MIELNTQEKSLALNFINTVFNERGVVKNRKICFMTDIPENFHRSKENGYQNKTVQDALAELKILKFGRNIKISHRAFGISLERTIGSGAIFKKLNYLCFEKGVHIKGHQAFGAQCLRAGSAFGSIFPELRYIIIASDVKITGQNVFGASHTLAGISFGPQFRNNTNIIIKSEKGLGPIWDNTAFKFNNPTKKINELYRLEASISDGKRITLNDGTIIHDFSSGNYGKDRKFSKKLIEIIQNT